jgi:hypothetical protein
MRTIPAQARNEAQKLPLKLHANCTQAVSQKLCCTLHIIIQMERGDWHCRGIACTRSFDVGLTSAEGQKQEFFKYTKAIFLVVCDPSMNEL